MSTKKLIKDFGLQGIVDFVESYPTRKEGCKQLGISNETFNQFKYVLNRASTKILRDINSGKVPYSRAYREIGNYEIFTFNASCSMSEF